MLRTIHDPLLGCSVHARPLSEIRAERAAGRATKSSDPASL
ncbi:hypothetical protein [Streptomyces sp. NPDC005322]